MPHPWQPVLPKNFLSPAQPDLQVPAYQIHPSTHIWESRHQRPSLFLCLSIQKGAFYAIENQTAAGSFYRTHRSDNALSYRDPRHSSGAQAIPRQRKQLCHHRKGNELPLSVQVHRRHHRRLRLDLCLQRRNHRPGLLCQLGTGYGFSLQASADHRPVRPQSSDNGCLCQWLSAAISCAVQRTSPGCPRNRKLDRGRICLRHSNRSLGHLWPTGCGGHSFHRWPGHAGQTHFRCPADPHLRICCGNFEVGQRLDQAAVHWHLLSHGKGSFRLQFGNH